VATVVALIVGGLLAFWIVNGYVSGASQASPAISVDAKPSGNTATSAGTIDLYRSAATGTSFDIDVVVADVHGLAAYQFYLLYSPSVLNLSAVEPGLFLKGPGGVNLGGSVPNADGQLLVAYADMKEGPGRDGSGVLARLTFQAVGSGVARVKVTNVILGGAQPEAIGDSNGDELFDGPVPDAFVAVDQPCPSAQALASGAVETAALPEPPS
jgi:hypothetical protein